MSGRRHVVLVTYGEPPTASFVDQLTYSWRILLGLTRKVDAIPRALLPVIAVARARGRRRLWRDQMYGSPLEPITERQARQMADVLAGVEPSAGWKVHIAYEYRHPLVGETVHRLPADEPVWIVPLYAADSAFTHELTREACEARQGPTYVLGAISPQVLGEVSASHVLAQTEAEPGWQGRDVALVLAAHGTVLDPPKPIDTGREATEALCTAISARLANRFGMVINGWLNHTRGGRWTEPPVDEALRHVADAGFRKVVYFPYGFLGDNAESQLEGRVALDLLRSTTHGRGIKSLHLPCLNDAPALLDVIARQIVTCASTCDAALSQEPGAGGCGRICQSGDSAAACELCASRAPQSAQPAA